MGDRTQVTLTVLKEHASLVASLYGEDSLEIWEGGTTVSFTFQEVNYGDLYDLDKLQEMGIAYDSEWLSGGDYGEGGEYLRFTASGEVINKTLYKEDQNPPLNDLLALIDSPEKLREYLLTFQEKVSILPLDNQVEYGKIYRAKQLIYKE